MFTVYLCTNLYQESHSFISGWRLIFDNRCLLLSPPSPPPPPPSPLPPRPPPPPPPSSNLFFGVLGGVVLLLCQPLLVPGLVSEDPSPIGRSLEVGGILLSPLLNLNLYWHRVGHPLHLYRLARTDPNLSWGQHSNRHLCGYSR